MKAIGKKIDPVGQTIANTFGGGGGLLDPANIYASKEQIAAENMAKYGGGGEALSRQQSEADVERKRLLQEQLARTRAARRGGYRALLSQMRFAPETGLQTTLGPQA